MKATHPPRVPRGIERGGKKKKEFMYIAEGASALFNALLPRIFPAGRERVISQMAAPIKDGFRWCGRGFMSVIWPSFALSGLINIFYGPVNVISVVSCIRVQSEVALNFPRPALIWLHFGCLNFLPAPTRRWGGYVPV